MRLVSDLNGVLDVNHDEFILEDIIDKCKDKTVLDISLDNDENNAIMKCCSVSNKYLEFGKKALEMLLKAIPNISSTINNQNKQGDTALIIACRKNHLSLVQLLLHYNASKTIMNSKGESASSVTTLDDIKRTLRGETIQCNQGSKVPDEDIKSKAVAGGGSGQLSTECGRTSTECGRTSTESVLTLNNKNPTGAYGPAPIASKNPPSTYNLLTDKNPPTAFSDIKRWTKMRDLLWLFGYPYKGNFEQTSNNKKVNDKRYWVYKFSRHIEFMQASYESQMSVLGSKGRCVEDFLEYHEPVKGWPKTDKGYDITTHAKLQLSFIKDAYNEIIKDLNMLNRYSNNANHERLPDITPEDKPKIIDAAYRVGTEFWNAIQKEYPQDAYRALEWYNSLIQNTEVDLWLCDVKYHEHRQYFKRKGASTLNEFKEMFQENDADTLKEFFPEIYKDAPLVPFTIKKLLAKLTDNDIQQYSIKANSIGFNTSSF